MRSFGSWPRESCSRRTVLGALALLPGVALGLAACGGSASVTAGTTTAASVAPATTPAAVTTSAASTSATAATSSTATSSAVTTSKASATSSTQALVTHKGNELLWAAPGNDQEYAVYAELAKRYTAAHPTTPVVTNRQISDLKVLLTNVAAGTGPDIVFVTIDNWPGVAGQQVALALDDLIARDKFDLDDFWPQIVKPYRYADDRFGSGKLYGLAKEIAVRSMYYNADALRAGGIDAPQAGQPWDWITYRDNLRRLTKSSGDQTSQWGYSMEIWDGMAMIWVWAAGGEYVDDTWQPTKVTLDSAEAIDGFQYWTDLVVKDKVAPPRSVISKDKGASTMFANSQAVTYNNGRWEVPLFRQQAKFNWDVMPIPKGPKGQAQLLTGSMFGLYTGTKQRDAAWQLLAYVTGKEGQTLMTQGGILLPSRQSIANSDTFLKNTPPSHNQIYLDEIPFARLLPMSAKYAKFKDAVNTAINEAIDGKKSATDALRDATRLANGILGS